MSLVPNPEFDRPGFCALCHVQIAEFDGPRFVKCLPNFATIYPTLDNGSKLVVTTCQKCKDNFSCSDIPHLMESVYKGLVESIERSGKIKEVIKEDLKMLEENIGPRYIVAYRDKEIEYEQIERELGPELMVGAIEMADARVAKAVRIEAEAAKIEEAKIESEVLKVEEVKDGDNR